RAQSGLAAPPGGVRVDGAHGAHELHGPGGDPGFHVLEVRAGARSEAARWPNDGYRAVRPGRAFQSLVAHAVPVRSVRVAVAVGDVCSLAADATGAVCRADPHHSRRDGRLVIILFASRIQKTALAATMHRAQSIGSSATVPNARCIAGA